MHKDKSPQQADGVKKKWIYTAIIWLSVLYVGSRRSWRMGTVDEGIRFHSEPLSDEKYIGTTNNLHQIQQQKLWLLGS